MWTCFEHVWTKGDTRVFRKSDGWYYSIRGIECGPFSNFLDAITLAEMNG